MKASKQSKALTSNEIIRKDSPVYHDHKVNLSFADFFPCSEEGLLAMT